MVVLTIFGGVALGNRETYCSFLPCGSLLEQNSVSRVPCVLCQHSSKSSGQA